MLEFPEVILKIAALVVAIFACYFDLRTRKIPNKLTFPAAFVGIILQAIYFASWGKEKDIWLQASAGAVYAILGWWTAVIIMSITKFFLKQMGHGDTKLMAAIACFLGPSSIIFVYLYYCFCFGIYSLLALSKAVPWYNLWLSSKMKEIGLESSTDLTKLKTVAKQVIPVAPFIALGTIVYIIFEPQTLEFCKIQKF